MYRYSKAKAKPIVTFSPAKGFNATITMNLKHWSDSPKVWFLHMTDHVTWYCVLCVVRSEKKKAILEKFLKHWVAISVSQKNL